MGQQLNYYQYYLDDNSTFVYIQVGLSFATLAALVNAPVGTVPIRPSHNRIRPRHIRYINTAGGIIKEISIVWGKVTDAGYTSPATVSYGGISYIPSTRVGEKVRFSS